MDDKILYTQGDESIFRYTYIDRKTEFDKFIPSLLVAQTTSVKRILTDDLYYKILTDFNSNPSLNQLTGIYLDIYNKYIKPILIFYTASDFIIKNATTIANGGNFRNSAPNTVTPDSNKEYETSKYYKELAASYELDFIEFMKDKNVPEYKRFDIKNNHNSYQFPWYLN